MKPRRNNKQPTGEEAEMEPVEVFARIKTLSQVEVGFNIFTEEVRDRSWMERVPV